MPSRTRRTSVHNSSASVSIPSKPNLWILQQFSEVGLMEHSTLISVVWHNPEIKATKPYCLLETSRACFQKSDAGFRTPNDACTIINLDIRWSSEVEALRGSSSILSYRVENHMRSRANCLSQAQVHMGSHNLPPKKHLGARGEHSL
ncbi:hypothetical protein AB1N83_003079 [Pleurotus pulmonarius]